eukprot:CAMPEP_0194543836 /NCGR_PEP_ID=MMETSP0253-20130528/86498_1 /TAXON_ID=2966 /ORGANISM="Noctiluca scintillans" /LENGTH=127 /DNA_ID=CAMNT_0039390639 /DNA_START=206 /DNA_END=590 /DNA_ORIENTATION=+
MSVDFPSRDTPHDTLLQPVDVDVSPHLAHNRCDVCQNSIDRSKGTTRKTREACTSTQLQNSLAFDLRKSQPSIEKALRQQAARRPDVTRNAKAGAQLHTKAPVSKLQCDFLSRFLQLVRRGTNARHS